jgi:hypothetical protein
MRHHIIDPTLTDDPDFTAVTQTLSILSTSTDDSPPMSSMGGLPPNRIVDESPTPAALDLETGRHHDKVGVCMG